MLKKKLLLFIVALAPIGMFAQTVKLAYVNAEEIFSLMPELSNIESKLASKQEEINKNGQALLDEYNNKLKEFEQSPATSESGKADQQTQLQQIQQRYQLYAQNSQQEMNQLQQELIAPLNKKISDAIKEVGDANNYTFIFDVSTFQSPIVYVNSSTTDITAEVKAKLGLK